MDDVVTALRDQVGELDALVSGLDDGDWSVPSACHGWSLADVLVHLAQTNEVALASLTGRWDAATAMWTAGGEGATVDEIAAAAVAAARHDGPEVRAWWRQTADDMIAEFETIDPAARVPWVAGDMAARTLCTTRLSETWIHTTDVAHGLGVAVPPTARLWHVARLVHRTIPYSFQRAGRPAPGPVRFELTAPDGAAWTFGDDVAPTTVSGEAHDLCRVAGQRAQAADTSLVATGPDADAVLALVRTFA